MPRLLMLALAAALAAGVVACERKGGGGSPGYSAPPATPTASGLL